MIVRNHDWRTKKLQHQLKFLGHRAYYNVLNVSSYQLESSNKIKFNILFNISYALSVCYFYIYTIPSIVPTQIQHTQANTKHIYICSTLLQGSDREQIIYRSLSHVYVKIMASLSQHIASTPKTWNNRMGCHSIIMFVSTHTYVLGAYASNTTW